MLTIADLDLTARCFRILKTATIHTVDDVCDRTPLDLRKLKGFGKGCLKELEKALALHGRALKGQTVRPVKQGPRHGTHYETLPHSGCMDPERCDCECPGCLRAWAAAGHPQPATKAEPQVELHVRQNVAAAIDVLRRIIVAYHEDEIGQIDGALIEEAEAALGMTVPPDPLAGLAQLRGGSQ